MNGAPWDCCKPAGSPALSTAPLPARERWRQREPLPLLCAFQGFTSSLSPTAPLKKEPHSSTKQVIRDQFMDNSVGQTGKVPGPIVMSSLGTDQHEDKQTDRGTGNSQVAQRPRPSLSSYARAPDPILPWKPGVGGWQGEGVKGQGSTGPSSVSVLVRLPNPHPPPTPSQQAGTFHMSSISRAE